MTTDKTDREWIAQLFDRAPAEVDQSPDPTLGTVSPAEGKNPHAPADDAADRDFIRDLFNLTD